MANTKRVTLSRAYVDEKGRKHKADATVSLPHHEAANLLHLGLARQPDAEVEKPGQNSTDKEGV